MAAFNSPNYPQYMNPAQPMYVVPQWSVPQQQTMNQNQQNNGIIWVQGEAGAKSYLIGPNTTVQLWDSESQTIYLKSADASGMPTIKILDYTIRQTPVQPEPVKVAAPENNSEFVTKKDFEEFSEKIFSQLNRINNRPNNNQNRRRED